MKKSLVSSVLEGGRNEVEKRGMKYKNFKTGDLLFIAGGSIESNIIEDLTGKYSHVVMIVRYPEGKLFFSDGGGTSGAKMYGSPRNNVFVFQASGMTKGCDSVYDGEPVEGVQLNYMEDYLKNYGPGKMWHRALVEPLSKEEEEIVYQFVEDSCKGHIPYKQNPADLCGALWFSATNIHWPGTTPPMSQASYFCSELVLKTYKQIPRLREKLVDVTPHDYAPLAAETLLVNRGIIDTKRSLIYDEKPMIKTPTYHSYTSWMWGWKK